MTLDEAIAESARRTIRADDNRETWMAKMLAWARDEDTYAWGIIAGAYEQRPGLVQRALREYWRANGPPAQPELEWREVEAPTVVVPLLDCNVEIRAHADGEATITFRKHASQGAEVFRLRGVPPLEGHSLIIDQRVTGGPS